MSIRRVPLDDKSIKRYQKRRDSFNHMTVMFKKEAVLRVETTACITHGGQPALGKYDEK